jgi:DNA polymerase-3 subunit epsilon
LFESIAADFLEFVDGADLIIHNAPFDLGFINHEIAKLPNKIAVIEKECKIIDTLALARQKHPGQKNNLDALCKRYGVDNSQRDLHGALLDAEILADVYLLMTGGQVNLNINDQSAADTGELNQASTIRRLVKDRPALRVIEANEHEVSRHQAKLDAITASSGKCLWQAE